MDKHLTAINIIFAIADTIVCLAAVLCFAYCAIHFGKWWITLFSFVPLALFNGHSIVVDADIQQAKLDALKPKGGEKDSTT